MGYNLRLRRLRKGCEAVNLLTFRFFARVLSSTCGLKNVAFLINSQLLRLSDADPFYTIWFAAA